MTYCLCARSSDEVQADPGDGKLLPGQSANTVIKRVRREEIEEKVS